MGVLLFFMLSGFLMSYLYAHKPLTSETLHTYAVARVGRVVPLYVAVVILSWLLWSPERSWVLPVSDAQELARHLFAIRGDSVLWTIPVELHFYIVFVLIWLIVQKIGYIRATMYFIVPLAIVCWTAALAANRLFSVPSPFLPFWIPAFLFGTVTGFVYRRYWRTVEEIALAHLTLSRAILILGVCIFLFPGIRSATGLPAWSTWRDPAAYFSVGLFFLSALAGQNLFRGLARPTFRWLGNISYSLYLFHLPVLMAYIAWIDPQSMSAKATTWIAACATVLLLADLSYRFFEKPTRDWIRDRQRRRHLISPA